MKNKIVLIMLLSFAFIQTDAHALDLRAVSNSIELSLKAKSTVSRASNETVESLEAGDLINVRVDEHVVIRAGTIKISFSPLHSNASFDRVVGVSIPEVYSNSMTLLQAFYLESGISKNECKVLVLENLFDDSHKTRLRKFLGSKGVSIDEQGEYFMFDCQFKKRGS